VADERVGAIRVDKKATYKEDKRKTWFKKTREHTGYENDADRGGVLECVGGKEGGGVPQKRERMARMMG